ncbi:S41 family peptidase [Streptomyces marianii]|uniref:Peptidase S41 n=1 Tax=Streptomyces marianii TaxID=1817406 RepID=A0A5R9EB64_9ACTN|nr:S41 family peptidase [Streptomyces marianii]TLQ45414.1 peptidase S41 [Streptomyces marianii]
MSEDVAYLRFPHLHDDLLCFAAEDDLWIAPLVPAGRSPGRAWRVTVDRTRIGHPRFSPDGSLIAYTTWRSLDPEIHLAPVDGGPARRLGYWGSTDTRVCGWDPDGNILAVSSHGQPFSYFSWAYKVPTDGDPGKRLPWGPVSDIAVAGGEGQHRTLLLTGKPPHEPAGWKRYRGGAMGRLYLHGERLLADIGGHLDCPMFVNGRIAFLSDHEGVGNLYSCLPDGTDLRRHTDHDAFYARHASSDGSRVVYQCAGDLWIVEDLAPDSRPRKLNVRLGGPRAGRRRYQVPAASHVDGLSVDTTGRASAVVVRGSLYWLTHRDGPARTIADTPGVRVRLPVMLGSGGGQVAYVTDADGEDAVEIAYLPRASGDRPPRRLATGRLGRVLEMVSDPAGERLAIASHDGRLLLLTVAEQETAAERAQSTGDGGDAGEASATDGADGAGTNGTTGTNGTGTDGTRPDGAGTSGALRAEAAEGEGEGGTEAETGTGTGTGTETGPTPGQRQPATPTAGHPPTEPGARSGALRAEAAEAEAGTGTGTGTETGPTPGQRQPATPTAGHPPTEPGARSGALRAEAAEAGTGTGTETGPTPGQRQPATPTAGHPPTEPSAGTGALRAEAAEAGTEAETGTGTGTGASGGSEAGPAGRPGGTGSGSTDGPGGTGEDLVTELIRSGNGPVRDLAFSPLGNWLTWSHPFIGRSLRQIKMARIDGPGPRTVVDVTNGRFEDESPVFTRDGRYLAFLSWRGFDPVYDVHTGDLSFPLGCRPYLVPLSSATPSPFALLPDGRPAAGGLDPTEADMGEGAAMVEVEGLESRVTPFPVAASKYSSLHPVAGGGLVWLRWPISGALGETFANPADPSHRPTLEYFDIPKARRTELVAHLDWFAVSGDGSRLVVFDDGELRAVPATESGDSDSTVYLDMRRILHEVDPPAEWRGAYEEAGRLIRDYYWDPGMCGIDWSGVLDQYRPLLERVASPDEFADLLREVLGELGTSHAYVTPARRNEGPPHYQRAMGLLGANLARREEGWAVVRILPGDSSDSKARSPLAGTGIREGAVLTHVDGRPVDRVTGPYPLLSAAGGTTVELTFRPAEGEGRPRRVAVVPLVDERPLRYQDWVAKRRAVVRKMSGGECGYLHIPDLGGSGWAQFNRDVRMEVSRPSLIVDVRGNAGGHISELVIEQLSRTILGWDLTRNAQPVSYTSNAPRGPIVALADEATSSDGDMITAAIKLLGLGPVVGQRTWGGVVGMTGRHRLADGTVITVPMNAAWFEAYGWSVENHGVEPDIFAERPPLHWAEGKRTDLDTAVQVALDRLAKDPAKTPPGYENVPDRRRPPLPPRG